MLVVLVIVLLFVCGVLAFYRPVVGFIAGAAFGIALVLSSFATERIELVVGGPVVFVTAFVVMVSKKYGPWVWRILTVCGLVALVPVGFAIFGQGGSLGLLVFLMFIGAWAGFVDTSESATAVFVISTIGSAMRQNLPLPMALETASQGLSGKRARVLRAIKKWLVEGYSLSESLKRGYPRCPGSWLALVAAGEKIGQVPQAIAAIEQDMVAKVTLSKKVRHTPAMYPPILLFFMFVMVFFTMTFVLPRYREVLKEMAGETKLPAATELLLKIVKFVAYDYGWLLGLLLLALVAIYILVHFVVRTRCRRPEKPYLISRISDFVRWHLPFLRWYEWNRAMQRVAGMLRLSLNAGCTLDEAIAAALSLDVNYCFKKHLQQWLKMVENGDNIGRAAEQCGMGSAMAWAFADMENHQNTLEILQTLESSYRWGYNRLAALARFIIGPCETLCLGFMVGFIIYAVFASMVAVIYAAAGAVVP